MSYNSESEEIEETELQIIQTTEEAIDGLFEIMNQQLKEEIVN